MMNDDRQVHDAVKLALRRFHDVYLVDARIVPCMNARSRIAALYIMRNCVVGNGICKFWYETAPGSVPGLDSDDQVFLRPSGRREEFCSANMGIVLERGEMLERT